MRVFELQDGEITDAPGKLIVDLDFLEMLQETPYDGRTIFSVRFSSGCLVSLTKPAFDRILLAWKSH